jgi:hypothetical protein
MLTYAVGGGLGPESGRAQVAEKGRGSPTRFRALHASTSGSRTALSFVSSIEVYLAA